MKRLAAIVLVTVALGAPWGLLAQRQGGAGPTNPGARQGGGGPQGRQGGPQQGAGRGGGPARQVRDRALATGTAVVRGRVTAADTGAPLRRAQIQIAVAGQGPRAALSDEEGRFELRDLPAGSWTVRASKVGYVAQQYGQRSAFASSEPVVLAEGQEFIANFALTRGGVITGRIFDEFGDPVANAQVTALRAQWSVNGLRLTTIGGQVLALTDDTGAYRLYGLPPGEHYVAASPMAAMIPGQGLATAEGLITYATVYFPGTTDLAAAQRVTVAGGLEQSGISFGMTAVRAARVSGLVLGATGAPVQAMINLQRPAIAGGVPGRDPGRVRTGADGTFTIPNVAPGQYIVEVTERVTGRDVAPGVAAVPITVGGEDITGLTITAGAGATVTGTVSASNGTRLDTSTVRVTATPFGTSQSGWTPRATVSANGTFVLEGLVGARTLRFDQLPAGWAIESLTANGVDVADTALEFRGTEQVSIRVVLSDRLPQLSGTVASDQPLRGASVLVFPDDEARWTLVSRYVRTARVGEGGQFSISALPPHQRYLVVALGYLESGEHLDPAFLKRVKPLASSISLAEGEQKSIELPLVPRQ